MKALLSELKILDFTTLLPGPFATMMLADLGAEVLRVESPEREGLVRTTGPFIDDKNEISCFHAYLNRNKRSMVLDLKNKESSTVVKRLVETYDIIIEQFRPGVMERLGLSFEALSAINPKIIYCSLTGYGQTGPLRNRAGHDINFLALSGIMGYSGKKDTGPFLMGIQVADIAGAYNAVIALLSAVIGRMRSGKGQYIDVSIADCLFPYHAISAIKELYREEKVGYCTEMLNGGSLYDFYRTADGKYISFGGLEPKFFSRFCAVLGLNDFAEGGILQPGKLDEAKKRVVAMIASKPLDYWISKFKDIDACFEPVLSFRETVSSDQVKERELIVDVPGPDGKMIPQIAFPVKFSGFKPEYKIAGGPLGRDNDHIMQSIGFSKNEIESLKAAGIFG